MPALLEAVLGRSDLRFAGHVRRAPQPGGRSTADRDRRQRACRSKRSGAAIACGPAAAVRIEVLHPPRRGVLGSDNANSIVLAIEYQGRRHSAHRRSRTARPDRRAGRVALRLRRGDGAAPRQRGQRSARLCWPGARPSGRLSAAGIPIACPPSAPPLPPRAAKCCTRPNGARCGVSIAGGQVSVKGFHTGPLA